MGVKKTKTIDDLLALPEDARAELIDGEIVMMAPASNEHSRVQTRLTSIVEQYQFGKRKKNEDYWVIVAEAWTEYNTENAYVHDVAGFVSNEYDPKLKRQIARPKWVCEVMSPSNWIKDTQHLRVLLATFQVPFYWTVDPLRKEIVVYQLVSNSIYGVVDSVPDGVVVELKPFPGLKIDTSYIFNP